jgi:transmembrane 9 superfamily protein 2/4
MPFAVIFIELFFILKSIWFYYMFGFLGLMFVILVTTVIEITIVITYFQLCGEVNSDSNYVVFFCNSSNKVLMFANSSIQISRTIVGGGANSAKTARLVASMSLTKAANH